MSQTLHRRTAPGLRGAFTRRAGRIGAENVGLGLALIVLIVGFSLLSPRFLRLSPFEAVAFQLPELGPLTLAMLMPIISGGINLAVT